MYALKKITVTEDGRQVEEVHVLGDMYRLEFYPRDTHLAAKIEYCLGGDIPCIPVEKEDEAYITTLTGDTVRCICRGDSKARNEIARCRTQGSK
ncbi:TPA: hypothetical protein JWK76_003908 [Escherichia coli]|jgi:hypothetical protein|uniref:Uncharacterized protein n=2 Tax=Escherichia TaxID=561 RepID=A0A7L6L998_9ESCH|nr:MULTISPECIES: hypothetical protein [Escherichia]EFA9346431.1 hypothetical protein [Escherichia coli]EFC9845741.1 hypothetical protein [Escherichia coli]EFG1985285.1 hypothetical protein [Escherichia coli]EFK1932176.1 hypothetical protein [Escherichia coli]EFO2507511.1 hypothetical protein [Escherichia coli]